MSAPAPASRIWNRLSSAVKRNIGAAAVSLRIAAANAWRDNYNPLRHLDMQRAVSLLEQGERGAYADLQWTYRSIEMQDAVLGALVERRTSAIQRLDWEVKIRADVPDGKAGLAARQALALKAAYGRLSNLKEAIEAIAMATFRGYAHLEKVEAPDGSIAALDPVEQWYWVRDGHLGEWQLNPSAQGGRTRGEEVDLSRFLVREVKRPVNRVALVHYVRKGLSQKDWDAYVEEFGIPAVFVTMPQDVPEDKVDEYLAAAEQSTSAAKGVLPGGSEVKILHGQQSGGDPFREHLKYQDEQIVLRGTGGLLTMLAESGSGTLAGGAHSETFAAIAQAEAKEISEIFQAQFDAPILEAATPGEPPWAYWELCAKEETDTSQVVEDTTELARAGYYVDPAWIEEKTGYSLVRGGNGGSEEDRDAPERVAKPLQKRPKENRGSGQRTNQIPPSDRKPEPRLDNRESPKVGGPEETGDDPLDGSEVIDGLVGRGMDLDSFLAVAENNAVLGVRSGVEEDEEEEEGRIENAGGRWVTIRGNRVHIKDTGGSRETKNRPRNRDQFGEVARANISRDDNIKRGTRAAEWGANNKADVEGLMWQDQLGAVDLPWGRPGHNFPIERKSEKTGETHKVTHTDGYGASHIIEKHGKEALRRLPSTIADGELSFDRNDPLKAVIKKDGWTMILYREKAGRAYGITHFEKDGKNPPMNKPVRPAPSIGEPSAVRKKRRARRRKNP